MAGSLLTGDIGNILNFISAAAGLGTAAMGLVDATKAFRGGPSNFGFGFIGTAIAPFLAAAPGTTCVFGKVEILRTLKAAWLNGVPIAEQKAKAKALIHLGLVQGNAAALAVAAGVDTGKLQALSAKTAAGVRPEPEEIAVLGQFDVVLSAVLDAAYERADQKYRNACKMFAMLLSTILGIAGGAIVFDVDYWHSGYLCLSFLVGLCGTPLAPVAKDLATSLQAAVSAVQLVRR